jgi:hypothetical protein
MKSKIFLAAVVVVQLFVGATALIANATEDSDEYRAAMQSLEDASDDPNDFKYPGFVKFGAYREFPAMYSSSRLIASSQVVLTHPETLTTNSTGTQDSTEPLGRKQKSSATTLDCSSSRLNRKKSSFFSSECSQLK